MRRGTIFVILFIVVAAGVVGVSQFLRSQPPLTIRIAADPLAADWLREAVTQFNTSSPVVNSTQRVQAEVSITTDMDVWRGQTNWNAQNHPDAWLASSSASIEYAGGANLPFVVVTPSLARTVLVWGGYTSRVRVLTKNGTATLDWQLVAAAAATASWERLGGQANWQFVKLAFGQPDRTMSGLAVLFSGAAHFNKNPNLNAAPPRGTEFYNWLQPIVDSVPNFQTLGADVAKAVTRGPSTAEIALLPESQWLVNLAAMAANEPVVLSYPAYQFVFDFPLAQWNDAQTSDVQKAAVKTLGDWLASSARQTELARFGLRPAAGEPAADAALFVAGQQSGIQLTPDYGQIITPPSRTEAQGLIGWFSNQRR